ncbi:LysR family transcriptional regulator [Hyphomonas sp.]|uniref:LysR family transcriptional regulator n=1 Tax=Hyphomonas sp. TaxID=87 RepID=UPI0030013987
MSEIDRLIRFAAVAEELSFSKAARRLNVDQPWLSRQIQQLEMRLGFPLFVRSTRSVRLTREGELLYEEAYLLKVASDECLDKAKHMMKSHSQVIQVGVNPFTYWVPERRELFTQFEERHDRVSVEITSNYTSRLISKLRKRLIDFALIPLFSDLPDLESLIIHSSPVSLLVPKEDELANRDEITLDDLKGRKIPVTNPRINQEFYDRIYAPVIDRGCEAIIVPEGAQAIAHLAQEQRLPFISFSYPHSDPGVDGSFVHVPLTGRAPTVEYALVRRNEPPRATVSHFWKTAESLAPASRTKKGRSVRQEEAA